MTSNHVASDAILVERLGEVLLLTLNRPATLNAAEPALHHRLSTIWAEIAQDETAQVVVLTGAGRAFSAGGDLNVIKEMTESEEYTRHVLDEAATIVRSMYAVNLPVIAAVNGPAVGLGCSLAAMCDVVFIGESAYFSDPHVAVGLVAADGGALLWPHFIGLMKAKELLFLGERIPAQRAVELGLANHVVPDDRVVDEALALAQRLARLPQQALRETKKLLNFAVERSIDDLLDRGFSAEAESFRTDEVRSIVGKLLARSARG